MKGMSHALVFALFMMLAASCVKRPAHVLSDREMTPVLADLELADAYIRMRPGEIGDQREALLNGILKKRGVSRRDFDSTMVWYGHNVDKYYIVCESVEKELARRRKKIAAANNVEIQSTDLWPYGRMAFLSPLSDSDGLDFSIATSDVAPGQRLQWKLNFLEPGDGSALLGVEYADGLKSFALSSVRGKKLDVVFQTDTARRVARIFGHLSIPGNVRRSQWVDSIALRALPFDSVEYYSIYAQRYYRKPVRKKIPEKTITQDTIEVPEQSAHQKAL